MDRFGREILDRDGRVVRERLGQIVFGDPQGLADLNAIVHPKVRHASSQALTRCAESGAAVAIYDAALLVETGAYEDFDRLIVVACSRATQVARLAERDGLDRSQAEARIEAQAPLDDKVALADYVIDTDQSLEETMRQTAEVYAQLLRDR